MKKSNLLIALILIALSFSTGYLFFKIQNLEKSKVKDQNTGAEVAGTKAVNIKKPSTDEHWKGAKNARYIFVEYADLECPFCKSIHPSLVKLQNVYSGKLAWVYRHFPLPFHPKAQKTAEATECAAELKGNDGFWEMTSLIYEKMPEITLEQLPELATQLKMDSDKFKTCLDSDKYAKKVKDMQEEGSKAGIQGTPNGVIYDMKSGKTVGIEGALPYDTIRQTLDDFMAKNQ